MNTRPEIKELRYQEAIKALQQAHKERANLEPLIELRGVCEEMVSKGVTPEQVFKMRSILTGMRTPLGMISREVAKLPATGGSVPNNHEFKFDTDPVTVMAGQIRNSDTTPGISEEEEIFEEYKVLFGDQDDIVSEEIANPSEFLSHAQFPIEEVNIPMSSSEEMNQKSHFWDNPSRWTRLSNWWKRVCEAFT